MKYAISLLLGLLCGVALFIIGLLYNPFIADRASSPLSVGDTAVMSLNYTAVPAKSIAFTNSGEARLQPHPKGIRLLRDGTLELTELMVAEMRDARGQTVGIGVKFSSRSERTNLLRGEALVDSAWYVHLPGRGSFFVEQAENYWPFVQNVLVPAYRNSANSWKGKWTGDLSAGPGALGVARVTGVGGSLLGQSMAAVESLSVQAYSTDKGPVSAEGRLLIKLQPDDVAATD
ncbi:MAG: hypothetical protein WBM87_06815 [Woeseiaceae bacterium]